jgi:hypothetical protein
VFDDVILNVSEWNQLKIFVLATVFAPTRCSALNINVSDLSLLFNFETDLIYWATVDLPGPPFVPSTTMILVVGEISLRGLLSYETTCFLSLNAYGYGVKVK